MSCGRDPWEIIVQRAPRSIEWAIRSLGRKDLGGSWVDFPVIVFRRCSLTAGAVAFAHLDLEDSVPVIPRFAVAFIACFHWVVSLFLVSRGRQQCARCRPGRYGWKCSGGPGMLPGVLRRCAAKWQMVHMDIWDQTQMTQCWHSFSHGFAAA